jgi:hypothetical protein
VQVIYCRINFAASISLALVLLAQTEHARAESPTDCSRLIAPDGSVTWICPPATAEGGRWRNGEFIPACPPGMAFSRETRQCIAAQNVGGVIPCSPDDKSFIPGRGWVSNCQ